MDNGALAGRTIVVAGIGDDQGYGWGIAKECAEAGAQVVAATWVPLWKSFKERFEQGRYDQSRTLRRGGMLEFLEILPLDASYDTPDQVPEEVRSNKRYQGVASYTVSEFAQEIERLVGSIDGLVHSMAYAPEIKSPLLSTSREGYLTALSTGAYSWIALLRELAPLMPEGSGSVTISFEASQRIVPHYGGGMSSTKAALEADTRLLAYELGRARGVRVNAISAGLLPSRAARAIGEIERMIDQASQKSSLSGRLLATDVGEAAVFLLSPSSRAITGSLLYVDLGLHTVGPLDGEVP
jgi:enoyl-[acyl-carrier protein] reductase I